MYCWSSAQDDPVAGMARDKRLMASCTIDLQVRPGDQRMHAYERKTRKPDTCCLSRGGLMLGLAFRKQVMEDMRWAVPERRPARAS